MILDPIYSSIVHDDFELTVGSKIKILIAKNFANPSLPPSIVMMSGSLIGKPKID
jgi:hypothetical protein